LPKRGKGGKGEGTIQKTTLQDRWAKTGDDRRNRRVKKEEREISEVRSLSQKKAVENAELAREWQGYNCSSPSQRLKRKKETAPKRG